MHKWDGGPTKALAVSSLSIKEEQLSLGLKSGLLSKTAQRETRGRGEVFVNNAPILPGVTWKYRGFQNYNGIGERTHVSAES